MANHIINNIDNDASEWRNEIKSVMEKYGNQPFYIFRLLCQKKLYDFKRTKQRKVYNQSSKPKGIPFFRTSKKMLFFKSN